jgi:hypothetical protein
MSMQGNLSIERMPIAPLVQQPPMHAQSHAFSRSTGYPPECLAIPPDRSLLCRSQFVSLAKCSNGDCLNFGIQRF